MDVEKDKKSVVNEKALEKMKEEVEKIQYGSVTAVIQDGIIVQLDTSTKIRLV